MKRSHLFLLLFGFIVAFISVISIGGATWQIELAKEAKINSTSEPVCYIGNTFYTSIGKAIDVASSGDTIYVIPGDSNSIYRYSGTHTLKSGVTLAMPFDGTTTAAVVTETTGSGYLASNGYPDKDPVKWRKSQIIFDDNSKLIVSSGAQFTIGACYGGVTPEGGTSGLYTEVVLGKNSLIENYGTIYSFGFVKEVTPKTSQIISYANSEIEVTLSIYDWGSAGRALGRKMENVFPFKQYDFVNLQVSTKFYYGSNYTATWNVYGNVSGAYNGKISIFSTSVDSLIIAKGSSSDYMNYYTKGNKKADYKIGTYNGLIEHSTNYYFFGKFELGHLKVTIKAFLITANIDSKDYFLPIATNTNMELGPNAEMTSQYKVKFLMGTKLVVGKNATVNLNNSTAFYQTEIANSTNTEQNEFNGYLTKIPAQLINNGTIYINDSFGGYILTETSGAKIVTGSNFSNYVNTIESNSETNSIGTSVETSALWYLTNTANIDYYNNLLIQTNQIINSGTFISNNINSQFGFGIESTIGLNDIVGAEIINTNTKSNVYSVSLSNLNTIADHISWSIDNSSLVTLRQISDFEAQIDTTSEIGSFILTAQLMNGTTKVGVAVTKTISVETPGKLIESITVSDPPSYFKSVGDYFTLDTSVYPFDAGNKNLGYSSSNTNVAKVDNTGKVTAVGEGQCNITIFSQDGSNVTRVVSLTVTGTRINTLDLNINTVTINRSSNTSTTVKVNNYANAGTITISSSSSNISAVIDNSGTITISSSKNSDENCVITVQSNNGTNGNPIRAQINVTVKKDSSCLISGTLITLADGTKKKIDDLQVGDAVMVFNHATGQFDTSIIMINVHENNKVKNESIINLVFDDGTITKICYEHGFFDVDLKEYVYVNEDNYKSMIGSRFYSVTNGSIKLVDAYITTEFVKVYSPFTYKHLNIISDDLLSIGGDTRGVINIFELNDDMTINMDKMNDDINTYGLYSYEDWAEYLTEEQFDGFNVKYFKVSIGKGLTTKDDIIRLINSYL